MARSALTVCAWILVASPSLSAQASFRRGDANADGRVNIADPIDFFYFLFRGNPLPCLDAADTDDSGDLDLSDAIRTIRFLFREGAMPAPPGPYFCGLDPTEDRLGCLSYAPVGVDCPKRSFPERLFDLQVVAIEERIARVLAADVDGDSRSDVIFSTDSGGIFFVPGDGRGGFGEAMKIANSQNGSLVLGDLDGDGFADLITVYNQECCPETEGGFQVWRNRGQGAVSRPGTYPTGAHARGLDLADLDRDGALDIVMAVGKPFGSTGPGSIAVFLNQGDGRLGQPSRLTAEFDSDHVLLADLDSDGYADAVVTSYFGGWPRIAVNRGRGDGSFEGARTYDVPERVIELRAGDPDRDGDLDLYMAVGLSLSAPDPHLLVLQNDGTGGFPSRQDISLETGLPLAMAVADLDKDGRGDVVLSMGIYGARVFLADSKGSLVEGPPVLKDLSIGALDLAQLDEDGELDLLVARDAVSPSAGIAWLPGAGGGRFVEPEAVAIGSLPESLATADLNGDARPDFAVVGRYSQGFSVLLSQVGGVGYQLERFASDVRSPALVLADADGDGAADLLTASESELLVHRGLGGGDFAEPLRYPAGGHPQHLAVGDVDADGFLDLLAADMSQNHIALLRGRGVAGFAEPESFPTSGLPTLVALADVDQDGRLDAVAACQLAPGTLELFRGIAGGTFAPAVSFGNERWFPTGLILQDFDGDGHMEAAVADTVSQQLIIFPADFAEGFLAPRRIDLGGFPRAMASGDLAGDGKPQLVVLDGDSYRLILQSPRADGTPPRNLALTLGDPLSVVLTDFDGDGDLDAVVGTADRSNSVTFFKNRRLR